MAAKKNVKHARTKKSPSTQAGKYVREEIEHVRDGRHGARSAKASDRDRFVEGAKGGCQAAAPARPEGAESNGGPQEEPNPVRRHEPRPEARRHGSRIA